MIYSTVTKVGSRKWGKSGKFIKAWRATLSCGHQVVIRRKEQKRVLCHVCKAEAAKKAFVPGWPAKFPNEHFVYLGIEFNIARAWDEIIEKGRPIHRVAVAALAEHANWISTDDTPEEEIDLDIPLIAVECTMYTLIGGRMKKSSPTANDEVKMIIDGWHRVKKAEKLGVAFLPVVILNDAETKRIRTN